MSVAVAIWILIKAITTQKTFFDTVVYLTSSKLNLLIFMNCIVSILFTIVKMLVFVFFGTIRTVEVKVRVNTC